MFVVLSWLCVGLIVVPLIVRKNACLCVLNICLVCGDCWRVLGVCCLSCGPNGASQWTAIAYIRVIVFLGADCCVDADARQHMLCVVASSLAVCVAMVLHACGRRRQLAAAAAAAAAVMFSITCGY